MAIFRITSQTKIPAYAKKTIRYITHRRDRQRENITRTLYARHGISNKTEAYEAIDLVIPGTTFVRMVISTDPLGEDTNRDLDQRRVMEQTMLALQSRFPGQKIQYFAAIHTDHSDIRHVHILALITGRLSKQDLRVIRAAATGEAKAQRQVLDQDRKIEQGQQTQQVRVASATLVKTPFRYPDSRGVFFAKQERTDTFRAGPRRNPPCLTCGPWNEMERISRTLFHCANCGTIVKDQGIGIEVVRTPRLELTLGKETGWA